MTNRVSCRMSVELLGFLQRLVISAVPIVHAIPLKACLIHPHYNSKECWLDMWLVRDEIVPCIVRHPRPKKTCWGVGRCGWEPNSISILKPYFFERPQCSLISLVMHLGYVRAYANTSSSWTCHPYGANTQKYKLSATVDIFIVATWYFFIIKRHLWEVDWCPIKQESFLM